MYDLSDVTLQIWQVVMFDLSDVFPLTDGKTLCTICLTHLSLQIWQVVVMYDLSDVYQFIDMASRCYVRFVRRVSVYRYGKSLLSLQIWQVVVMYDRSDAFQFTDMASRCYVRSQVIRVSVYRYGKSLLCTICQTCFSLQIWQVVMYDLSDNRYGKFVMYDLSDVFQFTDMQVVVMYDLSGVYQFIDIASRYVRSKFG